MRRFNGKEADALSRLSYYGYRYYDELSLTWTQADPLYLMAPDIAGAEPRRMSLYMFSLNNPIRYFDPDGRDDVDKLSGRYILGQGHNNCFGSPCGLTLIRSRRSLGGPFSDVGQIALRLNPVTRAPMLAHDIGGPLGEGMAAIYLFFSGEDLPPTDYAFDPLAAPPGGPVIKPHMPQSSGPKFSGPEKTNGGHWVQADQKTLTPIMKAKRSGLSGKEAASNAPSWAKGQTPYAGEKGGNFAARLLDEKYGAGNWKKGAGTEYSQLKKWGDRAFQDPQ